MSVQPPEVLHVVLELARGRDLSDPFAVATARVESYSRREAWGAYTGRAEVDWKDLLRFLGPFQQAGGSAEVRAALGHQMTELLSAVGGGDKLLAEVQAGLAGGRSVRLTVQSAAAELYLLPWELVQLDGRAPGTRPGILVRYTWPQQAPPPVPLGIDPARIPGRLVFAWSAAGGRVPATGHLRALAEVAEAAGFSFDGRPWHPTQAPDADQLAHTTVAGLRTVLARPGRPVSVLALLCHGGEHEGSFGLCLDDGHGERMVADAELLGPLFAAHAETLRLVVIFACRGAQTAGLGSHLASVAQAIHRAGIQTVVASRGLLRAGASLVAARHLWDGLLGRLDPVEHSFLAARRGLFEAGHADWSILQLYQGTPGERDTWPLRFRPYRGLESFRRTDRRLFFGRGAEAAEVVDDLEHLRNTGRNRFIVVAGASGTGKSSVVQAAALPLLRARWGDAVRTTLIRPAACSLDHLDDLLGPGAGTHVLVVDQSEELFTHFDAREDRLAFARRVWAASADAHGTCVIVTLRVDFLGQCRELVLEPGRNLRLDRVAYDEAHRVFISVMDADQLTEVIERPARLVGARVDAGLADQMIADVEGEPGALPLLQYTLDQLWRTRVRATCATGPSRSAPAASTPSAATTTQSSARHGARVMPHGCSPSSSWPGARAARPRSCERWRTPGPPGAGDRPPSMWWGRPSSTECRAPPVSPPSVRMVWWAARTARSSPGPPRPHPPCCPATPVP